jgi:uncharacterized protein YxeA
MKKILITVIILLIAAGLVACTNPMEAAISQMVENNDAQNSSEGGSEDNASGSDGQMDVDIDENGNSVTISGDEGNVTYQGDENGMPWPGDKLPSSVPEIPGAKVVMVMDMDGGVMVAFENCEQAMADAYLASLKSAGWESTMNINTDEGYSEFFSKGNETLTFGWSSSDKTGSIIYGVSE